MMACAFCETDHKGKCALVKALEYHPDGSLKRVEFYAPNDYSPTIFANLEPPKQVVRPGSLRDVRIT